MAAAQCHLLLRLDNSLRTQGWLSCAPRRRRGATTRLLRWLVISFGWADGRHFIRSDKRGCRTMRRVCAFRCWPWKSAEIRKTRRQRWWLAHGPPLLSVRSAVQRFVPPWSKLVSSRWGRRYVAACCLLPALMMAPMKPDASIGRDRHCPHVGAGGRRAYSQELGGRMGRVANSCWVGGRRDFLDGGRHVPAGRSRNGSGQVCTLAHFTPTVTPPAGQQMCCKHTTAQLTRRFIRDLAGWSPVGCAMRS